MATVGRLEASLTLNTAAFEAGINRGVGQVAQFERTVERGFGGIQRQANALRQAIAALGAAFVVREIVQATVAFERINNTLRAGTGSAQGAAQAYAFVRSEAQRLGLDLETAATQFAKLSAAARGTSIQGQETRDIFTAVAQAMTVLGGSSEQAEGAFRAIEQIISKGTVSSEELRGQLGERLPGAFQIAARAMGVTTQELGKLLQQGQVLSDDFLPKFAAELQKTFGPEAENAAKGLQASINRLNTAVFEFTAQVGQGGVASAITDFSQGLTAAAQGSENLARQLGVGLGTALRGLGQAFLFVARNFQAFTAAAAAFAAFKLAGIVIGIAGALIQMGRAIRLAAAGMVAFQAASKGIIGIAQAVAAGVAALAAYKAVAGDVEAETQALTSELESFGATLDETTPSTAKLAAGLDDAADSMTNLLEQARRENQQLTALKAANDGYGSSVEVVNQAIEIDNALRAAKITRQEAEESGLLALLVANQNLTAAIEEQTEAERSRLAAAGQSFDELARLTEQTFEGVNEEQQRQADRAAELMLEPFKNALGEIQSLISDTFVEIFEGGITTFKDLGSAIKDIFIRLAAEIATLMVIRPVLAGLPASLGGLGGGGGGFGGLFSGAALGPAGGGAQFVGLPGAGAGGIQGLAPAAAGFNWGGLFAAGALGAIGGSVIAPLIFGGRGQSGIGGGIGGGIGAAAGTFFGGPIGGLVGGVGGSLLGGAIGSIFGGGNEENQGTLRFSSIAERANIFGGGGGPFGGFEISGEDTFAGPLRQIIEQFDENVAGFLTGRQRSLATRAVQRLGEYEERFPEADPSEGFAEVLRNRSIALLGASFPKLDIRSALEDAGSVDEVAERVQKILQTIQTVNELTGELPTPSAQLKTALGDIREQFTELRLAARALGLDVGALNEAQREALQTAREQFVSIQQQQRIQDRLEANTRGEFLDQLRAFRPLNIDQALTLQLRAIGRQFFELRLRARELGVDLAHVTAAHRAAAQAAREQAEAARQQRIDDLTARQDALQARAIEIRDTFDNLLSPLRAFQTELLTTGASPAAAFEELQRQFLRVQGQALGGNIAAIQQLPDLGRALIQAAEQFGASPLRTSTIETVQAALDRVISRTSETRDQAIAGLGNVITQANRDNINTQVQVGADLRDELRQIKRELQQLNSGGRRIA